jgi:hypothetical protein
MKIQKGDILESKAYGYRIVVLDIHDCKNTSICKIWGNCKQAFKGWIITEPTRNGDGDFGTVDDVENHFPLMLIDNFCPPRFKKVEDKENTDVS